MGIMAYFIDTSLAYASICTLYDFRSRQGAAELCPGRVDEAAHGRVYHLCRHSRD